MKLSIPIQILIAVILGAVLGSLFSPEQLSWLSEIGKVFIHWVKLIAGPFLFCTILISIIQVDLKWSHGIRVISIALFNSCMALAVAITLSSLFFKNTNLTEYLTDNSNKTETAAEVVAKVENVSFGFSQIAKNLMPQSLFSPFVNNDILLIAVLALIFGVAIRSAEELSADSQKSLVRFLEKLQGAISVILHWIIKVIPIAVFAIISATVSKYGFSVFADLSKFLIVVTLGFVIQIVFVYGTWIFIIAKMNFKEFVSTIKTPVFYSLGVNSSLATLPLTLMALKKLKVSDQSASLGAGVATNLNNDGILLYEAMAVIFISYAYGLPTDPATLMTIALTCVVASIGITGIPEAGFISLSVIVGVLALPTEALPLLLSVDWILARFRSAVNVLSDVTLSVAMDATE